MRDLWLLDGQGAQVAMSADLVNGLLQIVAADDTDFRAWIPRLAGCPARAKHSSRYVYT